MSVRPLNAFHKKEQKYVNAYADGLKKIKDNESLGRDHLAHIIIHEISHVELDTKDNAYIQVLTDPGHQNIGKLTDLLNPPPLPESRGENKETDKQRRARGSEDALQNADSFATTTRYLAYASRNPQFMKHLMEQKEAATKGASFLVKHQRW